MAFGHDENISRASSGFNDIVWNANFSRLCVGFSVESKQEKKEHHSGKRVPGHATERDQFWLGFNLV